MEIQSTIIVRKGNIIRLMRIFTVLRDRKFNHK